MMQQQGKLKRCPSGAALDMSAVDFEGCIALLEAVQKITGPYGLTATRSLWNRVTSRRTCAPMPFYLWALPSAVL